jgi:hypothetical protein
MWTAIASAAHFTTLVDGSALRDLAPSGADVQTEFLCFVGRHP